MDMDIPIWTIVAGLGLVVGTALGYIARWTRFCTLSAVETAMLGGNFQQLRMWVLAIATAIIGTLGLTQLGLIDLSSTVHYLPRIALAGPMIGGFIFGLGMAAVGTCGFGSLLRAGGGDLRGLFAVLIIGVTGYMTIRGIFAVPRLSYVETLAIPLQGGANATLPSLVSMFLPIPHESLIVPLSLLLAGMLVAWCFYDASFRRNQKMVWGGVAVGALVVIGWYVTGHLGADDFDPQPVESLSFVAAAGQTVMYLMTFTGTAITFPVGLIFGVLLGSFLAAVRFNELRLDAFDEAREMRRHMFGAAMMGVGGVLSMGCSIGQGLTGVSTLALPSFLALFSMWAGAAVGLRYLIFGRDGFLRAL